MGPIIILDKSAFQAFSYKDLRLLRQHFMENLPPILALEILGDLSKEIKEKPSEDKVQELARKFGGSGPVRCVDHVTARISSLMGYAVPMTGQIPVTHGMNARGTDGSLGYIIDLHPMNEAILRWSRKSFQQAEYEFSKEWRRITGSVSLETFEAMLREQRANIPNVSSVGEIPLACDKVLGSWSLQNAWVHWSMDRLGLDHRERRAITKRWKGYAKHDFASFAPYAYYCLRATLYLHTAVRAGLVKWKSSNLLDLEYLFYLPFCMVFSSWDNLHATLAPLLIRADQTFVPASGLKADLAALAQAKSDLSDDTRKRLEFALGSYPIPRKGSVISEQWSFHCLPWKPGSGNRAIVLSDEEQSEAWREAKALFKAANG